MWLTPQMGGKFIDRVYQRYVANATNWGDKIDDSCLPTDVANATKWGEISSCGVSHKTLVDG
jgi:hypothetical protein